MNRSRLIEELAEVVEQYPEMNGGELFSAFRAAMRTARPVQGRRPAVSATWDAPPSTGHAAGDDALVHCEPLYDGPMTLDPAPEPSSLQANNPLSADGPRTWDGPPQAPSTESARASSLSPAPLLLENPLSFDGPSTMDGPPQPPSTAAVVVPPPGVAEADAAGAFQRPSTDRTQLVRGIICAPLGSVYHRRDLPNVRIPVAAALKAGVWRIAFRCETRAHHAALSHFIGRTGLFLRLDRFLGEGTPVKLSVKVTATGDTIHLRGTVGVESDAGSAMEVRPAVDDFSARWNAASVAIALRDADASGTGSRVNSRGT